MEVRDVIGRQISMGENKGGRRRYVIASKTTTTAFGNASPPRTGESRTGPIHQFQNAGSRLGPEESLGAEVRRDPDTLFDGHSHIMKRMGPNIWSEPNIVVPLAANGCKQQKLWTGPPGS